MDKIRSGFEPLLLSSTKRSQNSKEDGRRRKAESPIACWARGLGEEEEEEEGGGRARGEPKGREKKRAMPVRVVSSPSTVGARWQA